MLCPQPHLATYITPILSLRPQGCHSSSCFLTSHNQSLHTLSTSPEWCRPLCHHFIPKQLSLMLSPLCSTSALQVLGVAWESDGTELNDGFGFWAVKCNTFQAEPPLLLSSPYFLVLCLRASVYACTHSSPGEWPTRSQCLYQSLGRYTSRGRHWWITSLKCWWSSRGGKPMLGEEKHLGKYHHMKQQREYRTNNCLPAKGGRVYFRQKEQQVYSETSSPGQILGY